MVIRAKVSLDEWKNTGYKTTRPDGEVVDVLMSSLVFSFVYADSPENKKFWDATPSGTIEMECVNPEAIKEFDLLKEYYVDFIPVP